MRCLKSVEEFFVGRKSKQPDVDAFKAKEAFEAMMEGAAMMLDYVGSIEYTYTTLSGNKIHVLMDSP